MNIWGDGTRAEGTAMPRSREAGGELSNRSALSDRLVTKGLDQTIDWCGAMKKQLGIQF